MPYQQKTKYRRVEAEKGKPGMTIKENIQHILNMRQSKAEIWEKKRETLREFQIQFQGQNNSLQGETDCYIKKLNEGIEHFRKGYISIGVVGNAKQGKSLFWRTVGNIGREMSCCDDVIWRADVSVVAHNDPVMEPGRIRARICFRKREDIVKIVRECIESISPNYLKEHQINFEGIGYLPLSKLKFQAELIPEQIISIYDLESIISHFEEIRDLYGREPLTLTEPELLRTYMTRNNGEPESEPGFERYYKYLAVSRVDVYCRFYSDYGKLALVDTTGFETVWYEKRGPMLADILNKECDAVTVVTCPVSGVQNNDMELYRWMREYFQKSGSGKCLFYLVNHKKGENDKVVRKFREDLIRNKFSFAGCEIVDCRDPDEVHRRFMEPMLDKMLQNMEKFDWAYMQELEAEGDRLMGSFRSLIYKKKYRKTEAGKGETGMTVKEQIQDILNMRQSKAEVLEKKRETLETLKQQLQLCGGLYGRAKMITDEKLKLQYMDLFRQIQTSVLLRETDRYIKMIDAGILRFRRDYISIGTVGKERQGKSTFLQAVGNIGNQIIPAYDATSCTGATSVIHNVPDMEPGKVRVEITFRKPEELVSLVRAYIGAISTEYLQDHEIDFDGIAYLPLSELEGLVEFGNTNQSVPMTQLEKIVDHFEEIRDLYGREPMTLTDPALIQTYVAQNNGKGEEDPDIERYYKYLAVSRADIYCRFYSDCGKLVLVDTIGIGDVQYGIEQAMLDTLDKECDAAVVVTRPISGIQKADIDIYDQIRERLKAREPEKWLFYLVNHKKGENDKVVQKFREGILKNKFSVAGCEVIDCRDQEEVHRRFMTPMLDKLLRNINEIDRAYLRELEEEGDRLIDSFRDFIRKVPKAETFDPGQQEAVKAFQKGKDCYHKMAAELSRLVNKWNEEKEQPNSSLWLRVQHILNHMEDIVPDAEALQKTIEGNGALIPSDLWHNALHYVRNELTDQFIALDDILEKETLEFKNSLVRILYLELRGISEEGSEENGECDMTRWLKSMMDQIIAGKPQYAQIYKAFEFLYRFEFNTRAQIIQEIRRQLYIINPICPEYAMPKYDFRKQNAGEAVSFYLTSRMSVVEDELRHAFAHLYKAPNLAFYAAAEEFYDRLTFASDLKNGQFVSMESVWGEFFIEYSKKLWTENAEKYNQVNELVSSYQDILQRLEELVESIR